MVIENPELLEGDLKLDGSFGDVHNDPLYQFDLKIDGTACPRWPRDFVLVDAGL